MPFTYPPCATEILPERPYDRYVSRFKVRSRSSGSSYTISYDTATRCWTCSCRGCITHGHCKHLSEAGLNGRKYGPSPVPGSGEDESDKDFAAATGVDTAKRDRKRAKKLTELQQAAKDAGLPEHAPAIPGLSEIEKQAKKFADDEARWREQKAIATKPITPKQAEAETKKDVEAFLSSASPDELAAFREVQDFEQTQQALGID